MNQSKFSLADVLSALTAIIFGFGCFLGCNFQNIENEEVLNMPRITACIVSAVSIAILLFSIAQMLKRMKRTNRNFKISFIFEIIFLVLFIGFATLLTTKHSPFIHYFSVSAQKTGINDKLKASIIKAENMFVEYENYAESRINIYEQRLWAVVNAQYINPGEYQSYGFSSNNGVSDAAQIDTKMFIIYADLFPTNYSDTITKKGLKESATLWLQDAKQKTSGWKPIGIVDVVNNIECNSNIWLNKLKSLSQVREQGEDAVDFTYSMEFDEVKTDFTKIYTPSIITIGIAIFMYILMLLTWIVTKRSTRFPGYKMLFSIGKSFDNEL